MYPENYKYTREHEWINNKGEVAVIGITHHAQDQLGDVVFVELPKVGDSLHAEVSLGTIESIKAVSDIYAPVSGEVVEVNESLIDTPEVLNQDPHDKGWLVKIHMSDKNELRGLMTAEEYTGYVAAETES
jgi:glycine cleavage system H protein